MENPQIDFEQINLVIGFDQSVCLKRYLKDIFDEISGDDKIVSRSMFNYYFNFPFSISNRIFNSLIINNNEEIDQETFTNFVYSICATDTKSVIRYFLWLNTAGDVIGYKDLRNILYHLVKKLNLVAGDQGCILDRVSDLVSPIFKEKNQISVDEFLDISLSKHSDLLVILFLVIILCVPFTKESLKFYEKDKRIQMMPVLEKDSTNQKSWFVDMPSEQIKIFTGEKFYSELIKLETVELSSCLLDEPRISPQDPGMSLLPMTQDFHFYTDHINLITAKKRSPSGNLKQLKVDLIFDPFSGGICEAYTEIEDRIKNKGIHKLTEILKFNNNKFRSFWTLIKGKEMFYFKDKDLKKFKGVHIILPSSVTKNSLENQKTSDYYTLPLFVNKKKTLVLL